MSKKIRLLSLLAMIVTAASCNNDCPEVTSDSAVMVPADLVVSDDSAVVVATDRSSNTVRLATALRAGDSVFVVVHRRP